MTTSLAEFAATLAPGQFAEYVMPALADNSRTGSYPFDPPLSAVQAGIGAVHMLDWATMMDRDPVTKKWFVSGGRPFQNTLPTKMVVVDEEADDVRGIDQWSGGNCGHLYRCTTVIPEHRRVAYLPPGGPSIALMDADTEQYVGSIPQPDRRIGGFTNGWAGYHFLCWFPGLGPQGSLVFANSSRSRIVRWDWATSQWLAMGNFDGTWTNRHINGHYHPLVGKMIVGSSTVGALKKLAIINADGTLALTSAATPCTVASNGASQFFPHPTRDASINLCQDTDRFWSYEWSSDTWVDRGPTPTVLRSPQVIACPTDWGALLFEYAPGGGTKAYGWKPDF